LLTTDGLVNLWDGNLSLAFKKLAEANLEPSELIEQLFARTSLVKRYDDLTCFVIKGSGV